MAYSGKTTNFDLPIFESNDKGNWYDINTGNNIIDGALEANKQSAETANAKADSNTNALEVLNNTVAAQGENINKSTQDISNLEQTVDLQTTHLNEIDVINQNQTQRITALENTESGQGTEINQIKSDITEISGLVQQNTQNIASAETEIQALQNITDSMQDDINNIVGGEVKLEKVKIPIEKVIAGSTLLIDNIECDGLIVKTNKTQVAIIEFTYTISNISIADFEKMIINIQLGENAFAIMGFVASDTYNIYANGSARVGDGVIAYNYRNMLNSGTSRQLLYSPVANSTISGNSATFRIKTEFYLL